MKDLYPRRLSQTTQALITRLTTWRTLNSRWEASGDTIALLDRIGETSEPLAIPHLMSFGFVRNPRVRIAARSAILRLFPAVPMEGLPQLDEALRQSWAHLEDWYGMKPTAIAGLGGSGEADQLYLSLVSCHRSGYVRAEALRVLSLYPSPTIIPFVLIRLADWVSEVGIAAGATLRSKLKPEYADAFVTCLGLMRRLAKHSRWLPDYSRPIEDLLRSRECADSLRRGIHSQSRDVRRQSYRIATGNPSFPTRDIIQQALIDSDVIVRKWAFVAGFEILPEERADLMRKAASDPYGPIRRMAFDALLAQPLRTADDFTPYLFDRSASIRLICQSAISEKFGQSPADVYRAAIHSPIVKRSYVAVMGLAETGNRSDAGLMVESLVNQSARVRRAAVRALRILGVEGHEQALRLLLASDVPSVAKESASSLMLTRNIEAEELWAEALKSPHLGVRIAVLGLLRATGKWQGLKIYFQAAASSDPQLSDRAIYLIARWLERFNSTFSQASAPEALELLKTMDSFRSRLNPGLARNLEFILQTEAR